MSNVPNWYQLLLLGLAAWRTYRLLAEDIILERPRRWLVNLDPLWRQGQPLNIGYRDRLAEFINCPYCLGAWTAIVWWAAWLIWPHATLIVAAPCAISAILIAAAKLDER